MDEKTLKVLEYSKVIDKLASYASFSASAGLAMKLKPFNDYELIYTLQKQTGEAQLLISTTDISGIGSAYDVRGLVDRASRGGVLEPAEMMDIKTTLIAGRELLRVFERKELQFPLLLAILRQISLPVGLIENINQVISDQAEVLDSASIRLGRLRSELKTTHERLFSKLQRIIADTRTAPLLQEGIITQRDGRYVVPLRAEFKGQFKSIVHDQSSSGATLFVEPLVIVDLNNRLRELELEERNEVHKILGELSLKIGERAFEITGNVDALAHFDMAIMRAKYALDLKAVEPVFSNNKKEEIAPVGCIKLLHARHPLLDPGKVVPIDVIFDPGTYCLVITGPNTGGKTVTLKTVGLLVLMAQSGLYIPAQSGSELGIYRRVFADIGDEQSIEQSLSTFSGHVKNLVHILGHADSSSLVLLDELGAGTDPQEGSTLARAILEYVLIKKITSLVATHYPELKAFAYNRAGVMNASLEFNLKTLRPTYHLVLGIPGRSNALIIAERLGMPSEIIENARTMLKPDDLETDNLLDEITRQRDASKKVRSSADRMRSEVEKLQKELRERLDGIENERTQIVLTAREQAEKDVEDLLSEIEMTRRELVKARQPLKQVTQVKKSAESIRSLIKKPLGEAGKSVASPEKNIAAPYQIGDKVFISSLQMRAVISDIGEDDVEVQFGSLRARTVLADIKKEEPSSSLKSDKSGKFMVKMAAAPPRPTVFRESPGLELSIRGQRVDDAQAMVERYLENAYMAHLPFARIVHGKGTGTLRKVVQEMLMASSYVESWEIAGEKEGGAGVTVVKFKPD
ncbi:MAG: endonuclease MutS2 [Anaerolineaceae bacterium]